MDESYSLDLVDLPDSPQDDLGPVEPVTPEALGRTAGGHDLHENGGLGEITSVYQQPQQNRTCVDRLNPLLGGEYVSAQSLLDAYSRSPPDSFCEHFRGYGPVLTFGSDFDQTEEGDHQASYYDEFRVSELQCPAVDRVQGSQLPMPEFEFISPFTCDVVFEARAMVRRSVTDGVSSKLAQDLAYKLEQRRAWERQDSEQVESNKTPPSSFHAEIHGSPLQSVASADEGPGVLRRMHAFQEKHHKLGMPAHSSIPATDREIDHGVPPNHPKTRRGDDAAIRRVSSFNTAVESARANLTHGAAAQMPLNACDMITINLIEAKMLSSRKVGGLPDPCAWISLHHRAKAVCSDKGSSANMGAEKVVSVMDMKAQHSMVPHFKSTTATQTQDPTWRSAVSLTMAYQSTTAFVDGIQHDSATLEPVAGQPINLFITVHDAGMKKCDFLGQAAVLDILPGTIVDRWVTLQRRDGNPQMESLGGRVSSVRMKIEYISTKGKGTAQPIHPSDVTRQGNPAQSPDLSRAGPRRYRVPIDHQTYALKLQAAVRRVFANRAFRLTLLQRRLEAMEFAERDLACDTGTATLCRRKPLSPINLDADIIASSSDYCEGSVMLPASGTTDKWSHDLSGIPDGRLDLMDYALRDRSILGQAEALANLGLGLYNGREEFREQSLQYLYESWDLLKTLKPAQLQHDRAQSIIQRIAESGAFNARQDLSSRLAAMSRRSTILNNEKKWESNQNHASLIRAHTASIENVERKERSPLLPASDMSWKVIPTIPSDSSSFPTPDELERIYRVSCKTTSRYNRKLREMPAGEAAEVLRRKMGLLPVRGSEEQVSLPTSSTASSREQTSSPASSVSVASLGICRSRPVDIIELGQDSDGDSSADVQDNLAATWGGIQRGQVALSSLITSCVEFKKAAHYTGRSEAREPFASSTPCIEGKSLTSKGTAGEGRMDRANMRAGADMMSTSSTSRLATLEAQLRALDNFR